jgi:predicted transcriptional regulator
MKETVKKIRELLDELESNSTSEEPSFKEAFQLIRAARNRRQCRRLSPTIASAL